MKLELDLLFFGVIQLNSPLAQPQRHLSWYHCFLDMSQKITWAIVGTQRLTVADAVSIKNPQGRYKLVEVLLSKIKQSRPHCVSRIPLSGSSHSIHLFFTELLEEDFKVNCYGWYNSQRIKKYGRHAHYIPLGILAFIHLKAYLTGVEYELVIHKFPLHSKYSCPHLLHHCLVRVQLILLLDYITTCLVL